MLFLRLDLKGGTGKLPLAGTIVLGRSNTADLVLACKTVSRIHCRIRETADGQVYVEDLGSELGTRVNGRPAQGAVPLRPGHVLQVGTFAFTISDDSGKVSHPQPVGPGQAPSDAETAPIPAVKPSASGALAALSTADDMPPPSFGEVGQPEGLRAQATDDDFVPPAGWQTGPQRTIARPAPPPPPADTRAPLSGSNPDNEPKT